jgi:hypothetical protein
VNNDLGVLALGFDNDFGSRVISYVAALCKRKALRNVNDVKISYGY